MRHLCYVKEKGVTLEKQMQYLLSDVRIDGGNGYGKLTLIFDYEHKHAEAVFDAVQNVTDELWKVYLNTNEPSEFIQYVMKIYTHMLNERSNVKHGYIKET